jgi:hypothetical protein
MRSIAHPSWWVHNSAYSRVGEYNGVYKIAMDYDMMCRLSEEKYAFYGFSSVRFEDTGISSQQYISSLDENKRVFQSHFGSSLLQKLWQLRLRLLHQLLQTPFGKLLFVFKKRLGGANW